MRRVERLDVTPDDIAYWRGRPVVYRCYDAAGDLLYVGCSANWPGRLRMHAASPDSTWWAFRVAKVRVRLAASTQEALEAERAAIQSEKPKCNIYGRGPRLGWTEADYGHVITALESRPASTAYRTSLIERLRRERELRFPAASASAA